MIHWWVLVLSWVALAAQPHGGTWAERDAVAMGTWLHVGIESETLEAANAAVEASFDTVSALESNISTWRSQSELSSLNAAPLGVARAVSPDLFALLSMVWDLSAATDGAFDPTIGALVDAWDLRGEGRQPEPWELARALASTGRRCFELRPVTTSVSRECGGAWIDAGAFGKGAALRRVERLLSSRGIRSARIDFGGQVLLFGVDSEFGTDPDAGAVEIADPGLRTRAAFRWPGVRGSIATSSQSERTVEVGGRFFGHVLDPHTGRPVQAWGSVSVRSDDPLEADALATGLFAMGPERGIRWLVARPKIDAVFLVSTPAGLRACGSVAPVESLVPLGMTDAVSTVRLSEAVIACPTPSMEDAR